MAGKPSGKESCTSEQDGPTANTRSSGAQGGRGDGRTRRSFLRATAAAGLVGAVGPAAAQDGSGGATTVDVVEAGADPSGEQPIDDVLESVVEDGAVVEFPGDGEFVTNGFDLRANDFELRGNGARLYPEGGEMGITGQGWTVDGFEIDQRSSPNFARTSLAGGNYEVSRCIWRGQAGSAEDWAVVVRANSGSSATFTDCYWPDGAVDGGESSNFGCIGTFQDYTSGATLTFERCWFHGWSEDTIYASKPRVDLRLIDCYFKNTICGPRVSDVTMRGCTSVNDGPIPVEGWSGSSFQSGVWLNGKKGTPGEPLIEDCDFYIVGPRGATPVKGSEMPGPTTIRNTRIHHEKGRDAIALGGGHDITLENVTVSGDSTTRSLNGNVIRNGVSAVDDEAADPSPPIPEPPADGSIPAVGSSSGN